MKHKSVCRDWQSGAENEGTPHCSTYAHEKAHPPIVCKLNSYTFSIWIDMLHTCLPVIPHKNSGNILVALYPQSRLHSQNLSPGGVLLILGTSRPKMQLGLLHCSIARTPHRHQGFPHRTAVWSDHQCWTLATNCMHW